MKAVIVNKWVVKDGVALLERDMVILPINAFELLCSKKTLQAESTLLKSSAVPYELDYEVVQRVANC